MKKDVRYIAIGDIHGLDDVLEALLARLPDEGTLIFLGDYLDRGPASRAVIARLLYLEQERPCIFLRGNHEAMALAALAGDREMQEMWYANGGVATLLSYDGEIPAEHQAFLRRTAPYFVDDDYIFVHAGLPPGSRPEEVEQELLWWLREPFLDSHYDWGRLVIHGHTPTRNGKPEIRRNRINIDTGAVYGYALTALLLPAREFITVRSHR